MSLKKIHLVIVGGESGRRPRKMNEDWVLDILEQCQVAKVKFFFKQCVEVIRRKPEERYWIKPRMKCRIHFVRLN